MRRTIYAPPNAGGIALTPTAVKTSAYTAAAGDLVVADTSAGAFAVALPAAPADKTAIAVKLIVAGNTLTISRGGSDVFNKAGGSTSLTLSFANQGLLLTYKASSGIWYVVADDLPLSIVDTRAPDASAQANGNVLTVTGGVAGYAPPAVTQADVATNAALIAKTIAIVYRNPDGTFPARPSGYGRVRWSAPGANQGAWQASHAYAVNDVVTNGGNFYQAKTSFTSGASFTATNWNQIPMADLDELELTS